MNDIKGRRTKRKKGGGGRGGRQYLQGHEDLDVVEEHKRGQGCECGVVKDTRENDVLDVADVVCLVDLPKDLLVLDGDHLDRNKEKKEDEWPISFSELHQ